MSITITKRIPEDFKGHDSFIMSNFDRIIEESIANEIKGKKLFSVYSGYNFCGYVCWLDNQWICEVYRYGSYCETFSGTLEEIMSDVSSEYGYE